MSGVRRFFILIGPPGSGKGTLSSVLVQKNPKCVRLSTGELCRKHIAQGTEIGQEMDFAIKSGKLVPDSLISSMVAEWIMQQADDAFIILDGYPRTLTQAQLFETLLKEKFTSDRLDILQLTIANDAVIDRLQGRAICKDKDCQVVYSLIIGSHLAPRQVMLCDVCGGPLERRMDDSFETIKERLKTYYEHEASMFNFYQQH